MSTSSIKRSTALLAVVALLAACSGGGGASPAASVAAPSVAAPSEAASEAPSMAESEAPSEGAGEPIQVGYLPKDVVNKYFDAAKTGVDKAATELGGAPVEKVGPQAADAAAQIPFISDLTTQGVDAIIISAAGPDAVVPALEEAQAAGIKVVGFDAAPAVGSYDVFVNQVDFSGVGVNLAEWACELAPDCTGQVAVLSAAATADNQNQWIALMEETLATDPQFAGLELVETVYGDDDATISTTQAQALLQKYPELKVIVAPTTVGILAAAQVVSGAGSEVKVTGLGFPNDMKPFVADGTSPVFGLWSVPDLGYLAYYVADLLVKGEITGAEGETFTVDALNDGAPYTIGADGVVILGPAYRFDETNVNDFDF